MGPVAHILCIHRSERQRQTAESLLLSGCERRWDVPFDREKINRKWAQAQEMKVKVKVKIEGR